MHFSHPAGKNAGKISKPIYARWGFNPNLDVTQHHPIACSSAKTPEGFSGPRTFIPGGADASITPDQVHAGGPVRTRPRAAPVHPDLAQRPLEPRRAAAGEVGPLVHADAVWRAGVTHAVVHHARLAVGPAEPPGACAASQGARARVFIEAFDSVQYQTFGFVKALNHRYSLKGLKRPYIYDTPLAPRKTLD